MYTCKSVLPEVLGAFKNLSKMTFRAMAGSFTAEPCDIFRYSSERLSSINSQQRCYVVACMQSEPPYVLNRPK